MQKTEIICGKNAVLEVLRAKRRRCVEIFIADGKKEATVESVEQLARQQKIPCHYRRREEIAKLAQVEKHQGIAARVEAFSYVPIEQLLAARSESFGCLLILDGILDPQNLGSLIRTAHQLGVQGICLPKDHSAPVGPATMRTAAGAAEYMPIAQVVNLVSLFKTLKDNGYWIYGADVEGESLYALDLAGAHIAVVLGSEGKGLRRLVKEKCDALISIPMAGQIDSLNVSVAGGIILAETFRQRSSKKPSSSA